MNVLPPFLAAAALAVALLAAALAGPPAQLPATRTHAASGIRFMLVRPGDFWMGSPASEPERSAHERRHRRVIREPFYLSETEVTMEQFRRFAQATGYLTDAERGTPAAEHRKGSFAATHDGNREWSDRVSWREPFPNFPDFAVTPRHPVVHVSWNDAAAFARHYGFALPSEAQWEYAARAGTTTTYPWGDAPADVAGHANVLDSAAVRAFGLNLPFPFDDGAALPAPAGSYRPNAWGLRDVIGNVAEWVADGYAPYPADGTDERPARGDSLNRVLRGGSWVDYPSTARSADRATMGRSWRRDFIGFRVVMPVTHR